jgi:hypothetical protein
MNPKQKTLLKALAIHIPAAAAAVGIGAGGYALGAHRGVRKITRVFDEYNKEENKAIAQAFYNQGVKDVMNKQAELEAQAFVDELEKIALKFPKSETIQKIVGAAKAKAKGAWGGASKGFSDVSKKGQEVVTNTIGGTKKIVGNTVAMAKDEATKQQAAAKHLVSNKRALIMAGTGAAAVGAGGFVGGRMSKHASLEEISNAAFVAELEKVGFSMKPLQEFGSAALSKLRSAGAYLAPRVKEGWDVISKNKKAIGVAGGLAAGAGAGGFLAGRMTAPKD